jgi:putative transport protein
MLEFVSSHTVFALFLLLTTGIALGSFSWRGISFGTSTVLLVAIVFGHFGIKIPQEITDLGLVLFVYAIGLQVGPGFFKAFKEQGKILVIFCTIGLILSLLITIVIAQLFKIPADIATGIFAGSNTSTPALAAAIELASKMGFNPSNISVGYGITYPFSVISVVLIIQILPLLLKNKVAQAEKEWIALQKNKMRLVIKHFRIENLNCFGKKIEDIHPHHYGKVNISRIYRDNKFIAATVDTSLEKNDIVTVVGLTEDVQKIRLLFGKEEHIDLDDYEIIGQDVNIFSSKFIGKTIKELEIWEKYNVIITRIKKQDYDLPPTSSYELEYGDIIHIVGNRENVDHVLTIASDIDSQTNETNFLPFLIGLTIGIFIGLLPIKISDGVEIKIGMATGAFLVSLVIGYFGKIGSLKIYVPQAASNLSRDLGLMLFLAGVGTVAGSNFVRVFQSQGAILFLAGVIITSITILVPLLSMIYYKKFNFYSIVGTLGGFMTNLPAIIAARKKTNTNLAMLGYATIYPFALILKIFFIEILMLLLQLISSK